MQSFWNELPIELLPVLGLAGICLWLARLFGRRSARRGVLELERRLADAQRGARELRLAAERTEEALGEARRALSEIPEIAQRLSATRLRELPECALDLIEEIFAPAYAVFYRCTQGQMLATNARGSRAGSVGERLKAGQGLIGFAAIKQMPVTPDDAELDPRMARGGDLRRSLPREGFSVCLPIVRGNRTLAVVLVGPCGRNASQVLDLGRMIALMTSVAIASASVLKEQELLAQTDGLTGLLNKGRILHHLRQALAASGPRQPVSVFLFDIDHFKHFNDNNGHLPGDDLLRSLGDLLRGYLREGEYVGRYGGEEFLLVLPGVREEEAIQAAERIRATIARHPFRHSERQPLGLISISGGVATAPGDGRDAETLIGRADEALYEAKRAGRNRVKRYVCKDLAGPDQQELIGDLELAPLADPQKDPPRS